MTVEELLLPRYKVIADYPDCPYVVGVIIHCEIDPEGGNYLNVADYWVYHPEKYPHIFQPLQWWEERKLEDMPEYVNYNGGIYKVESPLTIIDGYIYTEGAVIECQLKLSLPATISEYESFINKL